MSRTGLWPVLVLCVGCRSAGTVDTKNDVGPVDGDGLETDDDGDGYVGEDDCDETNSATHAGAVELCNGVDDDCDGEIDEGVLAAWYTDGDGDGFGDAAALVEACEAPRDAVDNADDCNDVDATVFPGADEVCDEQDNDCDGEIDEGVTSDFHVDSDADGYGDPDVAVAACTAPDGHVPADLATDCDDDEPAAFPGNPEVCDELDNDCDDEVDEGVGNTYYIDLDGDGWGDPALSTEACAVPGGYAEQAGDCDDDAFDVNPDAIEVCNSIDDDCDGAIDDDDTSVDPSVGGGIWFTDSDGDTYGDPALPVSACLQPSGAVTDDTDCDDSDRAVNPGATEVCNSIDDDCDRDIDDDDRSVDPSVGGGIWYTDADADTYGDSSSPESACLQPSGTVSDDTDCDDDDRAVNPAATEVCNGVDDDCDGDIDDDDPSVDLSTATTWYADLDIDGYGDATNALVSCDQPTSYEADDTDCDDGDRAVNPSATEIWYDGVDQDCDEADDYDADGDGDPSDLYGGTDCDDDDVSVYGGTGCRPVVTCTHPDPSTLAAYDPSGISDIVFDDDCNAWLPTLISGTDYVYEMDATGRTTFYTGTSNHNIGSIALDPTGAGFAVGYSNVNYVGYSTSSTIPVVATSSTVNGSSWSNSYLNSSPASIAFDSSGCIWVPNFTGSGQLDCVETDGAVTTILSAGGYIESVALDNRENVYVSVGDTIYSVDVTLGTLTQEFVASNTVLDFVFDYNNDLYLENTGGEIELAPADGSASSTFATVSGQGKLAIAPDGYLVRVIPNPVSAASYEEFAL